MIAIACIVLTAALPVTAAQIGTALCSAQVQTAPFKGLALDADSGGPLAHSSVKVYGPDGLSEVCTTDADGRFATAAEFAEGRLRVCAWDNYEPQSSCLGTRYAGQRAVRFEFDGLASASYVPIRLRVGPRIELDFHPPGGTRLADYRAEIRRSSEAPGSSHGRQSQNRAVLHEGVYPWVRPNPVRRRWGGTVLYVLARDGLSCARVVLPDQFDGPLPVLLEPRGVLAGRIDESEPTPSTYTFCNGVEGTYDSAHVRAGVTIAFTPIGAGAEERMAFVHRAPIGRSFRIDWIQPGRWRVELRSSFFPNQEHELLVQPGLAARLEVRLGPPAPTGELRIRISDPAGDMPALIGTFRASNFTATVTGMGDVRRSYRIGTNFWCAEGVENWFEHVEHEGRWVMEAVLHDVPMGEYRVAPTSRQILLAPGSRTIRPGEAASFELAQGEARDGYGFRVREDGAKNPFYSILPISRAGDSALSRFPIENGVHAFGLPEDDAVAWCLWYRDAKRVYGDRSDFIAGADGHWFVVDLEPGYSIRLVTTYEDGAPARGVKVRFADADFATDASGAVLLACDEPDPELRLTLDGSAWVGGDLRSSGEFPIGLPDLRVTVAR